MYSSYLAAKAAAGSSNAPKVDLIVTMLTAWKGFKVSTRGQSIGTVSLLNLTLVSRTNPCMRSAFITTRLAASSLDQRYNTSERHART